MEGYSAKIAFASKELTAKERVKLKDTSNAISLDELTTRQGAVVITVAMYAQLDIHNEKSDNKDYSVFIIVDDSGNKYMTSSQSFITTFMDIADEMTDALADGECTDYEIEIYRKESKNFKGKEFITCSLV